jgi:integrase
MDPDIVILQGRRPESPDLWEAVITLEGKATNPRSLQTTNRDEALLKSWQLKEKLIREQAQGVPIRQRVHTFREAALTCVEELEAQAKAVALLHGKGKAQTYLGHARRIQSRLIPYFGDMSVTEITPTVLDNFTHTLQVRSDPRRKDSPLKDPTQSTIGNLNHSFRKVMKVAARNGWISRLTIPGMSKAGFDDGESRPAFSQDDLIAIERVMTPEWMADTPREGSRHMRAILRAYVAVAATVGMRPGVEMDRTRWGQVVLDYTDSNGQPGIMIDLTKKQGKHDEEREAVAYQGVNRVFDLRRELTALARLQGHAGRPPSDAFLFAAPGTDRVPEMSNVFRSLLIDIGRLSNRKGEERVLYSLRHYYGTEAIARGIEGLTVARQMGTSLPMLARYYVKADARRNSGALSGSNEFRDAALRRQQRQINPDDLEPWSPILADEG